ncbi:hypothetical protein [Nocardia brevicatena]|uniref:hypothetical protein n=1 Tax=Nocardia brevicatena TaxID=37327 RepID=UPI001C3F2CBE|nr:hypothetical protein [Nocardia brevicatena]
MPAGVFGGMAAGPVRVMAEGVRTRAVASASVGSGSVRTHSRALAVGFTSVEALWRACSPTWTAPSALGFSAAVSPPRLKVWS